jgi:hypothetical protein
MSDEAMPTSADSGQRYARDHEEPREPPGWPAASAREGPGEAPVAAGGAADLRRLRLWMRTPSGRAPKAQQP